METTQSAMQKYQEQPIPKHVVADKLTFHQNLFLRVIARSNLIMSKFTVEILVCLFGLGYYMPNSFVQNLVIEKLCTKKYPAKLCAHGVINATIEEEVQQEAAQFLMIHYLVRQIPSCVICLFMGTWSDNYGRKFAIIVPLVGNAFTSILYLLNYWYSDWPPEYIMFASIPAGLTGDYGGFFLGIPGFIRDHHALDVITKKIAIMDGTESVTSQIGPLIGGQLFSRFGYVAVFSSSIILHSLATIFAYLKVNDKFHSEVSWKIMLLDFWRFEAILQSFKTIKKKRDLNRRNHIAWSLVVVILSNSVYFGNNEIIYLYTRYKLNWNVLIFTYYNLVNGGCQAISSFIVLPMLLRYFHLSDVTFGVLGQLGFAGYLFGTGFANNTSGMFCVSIIVLQSQMGYITQRSCLTKWVPKSEIGKIMSIFAILQAVGRNVGQIMATQIYVTTIGIYVSTFYVIAGVFPLINACIYGWIFVDDKRQGKHQPIKKTTEEIDS